jgi:hypothetical protein
MDDQPKRQLWQIHLSTALILMFVIPIVVHRCLPLIPILFRNEALAIQSITALALVGWLATVVLLVVVLECRIRKPVRDPYRARELVLCVFAVIINCSLVAPPFFDAVPIVTATVILAMYRKWA